MLPGHEEAFAAVPNAVLDTNVCHAIFSVHDVFYAAQESLEHEKTAAQHYKDIQFRLQHARAAFRLTLLLNERKWTTLSPLAELDRTLTARAPAHGEHGLLPDFVRLFIYFIKDKLLPSWSDRGDLADAGRKGDEVDMLCLDWAEQHKVPLISWEGDTPTGPDPSRLIPQEAAKRGIDLVTPEALLQREGFTGTEAARLFFVAWDQHEPGFLSEMPDSHQILGIARTIYMTMARD